MKVELLIYAYIAICVSLILYNCVYMLILRYHDRRISEAGNAYEIMIREEISRVEQGMGVSEKHKKFLCRKLRFTSNLTVFDRSMERIYPEMEDAAKRYLEDVYEVFLHLCCQYQRRDVIKAAYFPYIISKYRMISGNESDAVSQAMFSLLHSDNLYCRENALKAIYSAGRCDWTVRALRSIDKNPSFHHPKLVCDGLLSLSCEKEELKTALLDAFETYSVTMQVNILNFFRFGGIRCDERMYEILIDEKRNQELRFSCIRYFEKYPYEPAREVLQDLASYHEKRAWEYQAIASSALKSYPDATTTEILKKNLSAFNWHVRLNSAISCERLGFSYADLIQVFDGEDRYAREILRYRFDRRKAESEAVKV